MVFGQIIIENFDYEKKTIPAKAYLKVSRMAQVQLHSTFQCGVKGPQKMSSISVKMPDYSPWFLAKVGKNDNRQKHNIFSIEVEWQHFSFIAPLKKDDKKLLATFIVFILAT